jgi:MYXO-CTERM domain-containing protein
MGKVGGSGGGGGSAGTDNVGGIDVGGSGFFIPTGGGGSAGTSAGSAPNSARPILKNGEGVTGCNCRAASGSGMPPRVTWLVLALAGALLARRRR